MNLKSIPPEERPREKALLKGIDGLSNAELIALILNSGYKNCSVIEIANKLLIQFGGLKKLFKTPLCEIKKIKGINEAKALKIKAISELIYRVSANPEEYFHGKYIKSASDVYKKYVVQLNSYNQEKFIVLLLNYKNKIIKEEILFAGGISSSIVDIKILIKKAIENEASKVICLHNHPSGDKTPSQEDIMITSKIRNALYLCDIKLLDHIIIGKNGYFSMAENKMF